MSKVKQNRMPKVRATTNWLLRPIPAPTERKLSLSDAAQIPLHEGVDSPATVRKIETIKTMKTDYAAVARKMQEIEPLLKQWVGY